MMASYVEPTPNKGSFRFGNQLHLLKDLPTALSPGVFSGAFLGRGLGGEGEQPAQLVGRRVGGCDCLQCPLQGMGVRDILPGGRLWEEVL